MTLFLLLLPFAILGTLTLIQIKHLIVDWIWQPSYEFLNKGTYLHFGGIRHAGKNALGTGLCFVLGFWFTLSIPMILAIIALDFVIHYHIDFAKTNLNRIWGLKCDKHEKYYWLLGVDQTLHQLTYLFLVVFVVTITVLL